MKKLLLSFLFLLFFSFISPLNAFAENAPRQELPQWKVDPDFEAIDDSTRGVTISFPDLADGEYFICLKADLCRSGFQTVYLKPEELIKIALTTGAKKNMIDPTEKKVTLTDSSFTVCADGPDKLKIGKCGEGDFFHPGHMYYATLYYSNGKKGDDEAFVLQGVAAFYVNHLAPHLDVKPSDFVIPSTGIVVTVYQDILRKDKGKNSNNYQIVLKGPSIQQEVCKTITETGASGAIKVTFPAGVENVFGRQLPADYKLLPGKFTVEVNERINEGGVRSDSCQGGYTYVKKVCQISAKKAFFCGPDITDPNESDIKETFKLLNSLGMKSDIFLPCKTGGGRARNCDAVDTAIGPIPVDPVAFIARVFSIILSIAAVGATVLIIYSGYRIMTSSGNKEGIQGARETLTAAIVGLLFIIFSLVILNVIGVDILKLPGLGK